MARQARGFYILTASDELEGAREDEGLAGGPIMGRFTAALVNGIETGAVDLACRGEILLSDLRNYLESVVVGQTPKFFANNCVFRAKSATDSDMKSATDSDLISAIPI